MQPKRQQTRGSTKQILIPIVTDLEDESEDLTVVPIPEPAQSEDTSSEPEEREVTPRPGGEKIPPGGWRGAETPRPGGEKIPPGGWRSEDDTLNPGDWRSQFRLPILIPVDEPPLASWDGEVYRTTDGNAYFHFKTTIVAHIIPPEEAGTGSVFATLIEYWTLESGLISIESIANGEDSASALVALAQMSTYVSFTPEGPEEIHQAFMQLQSQLGIWAETLWTYIHEKQTESDSQGEFNHLTDEEI